jgi:dihydroneopterin aldolase
MASRKKYRETHPDLEREEGVNRYLVSLILALLLIIALILYGGYQMHINMQRMLNKKCPKPVNVTQTVFKIVEDVKIKKKMRIKIREMTFNALIGIEEFELRNRQRVSVSVVIEVASNSVFSSENLDDSVDYSRIPDMIAGIFSRHVPLIETACYRIGQLILQLPNVKSCDVTLEKPNALKNGTVSAQEIFTNLIT